MGRVDANFDFEQQLWKLGKRYVVGLDEVGRGCFAGPVVVAAVVFPAFLNLSASIRDSKMLSSKRRLELSKIIKQNAHCFSIAEISVSTINRIGITKATEKGFRKCLKLLDIIPDHILLDGLSCKRLLNKEKQTAIIKGDQKSISIAAASIIAKVYRDELMQRLHAQFPYYHFAQNKGYGTKAHQIALKKYGLSKLHRTSFNLSPFLS